MISLCNQPSTTFYEVFQGAFVGLELWGCNVFQGRGLPMGGEGAGGFGQGWTWAGAGVGQENKIILRRLLLSLIKKPVDRIHLTMVICAYSHI